MVRMYSAMGSAGYCGFKGHCEGETVKKKSKKHPGFKAVASSIAKKGGYTKKQAGAILASATRKASAKAKKANSRLKRVK